MAEETRYPVLVDGRDAVEVPLGEPVRLPPGATELKLTGIRDHNQNGLRTKTVTLTFLRPPTTPDVPLHPAQSAPAVRKRTA